MAEGIKAIKVFRFDNSLAGVKFNPHFLASISGRVFILKVQIFIQQR